MWTFFTACEREILFLKQRYAVSDMTARLVHHRLRSIKEAEEIFHPFIKDHMPDPSHLPDMEKACEHARLCLEEKRPVGVWGDYDVDGACASALLIKYFRGCALKATPYVADRFQEGYGPNRSGLEKLFHKGIRDVFIVDCGTTAFDALSYAASLGMRVTVIDHHRVGETFPETVAFLNPKRWDYDGPALLQQLCAGALVFCFLVGLNRHLRLRGYWEERPTPDLFGLLDLVALSTICDMMPLRHLNRAFVKQGLKVMRRRQNMGLSALIDASGIKEPPTTIHLGYTVGPRINAGGRIGDASLGVRLLSCEEKEESLELAGVLSQLNQERQVIERKVSETALQQALEQVEKPYLFIVGEDWHEGVLGITASYLKESFHKPTFVLTAKGSYLKGSVRSVTGVDVGEMIHTACDRDLLVTGGGHPMAGGLTVETHKIPSFLQFIDDFFRDNPLPEEAPALSIDMPLRFEQLHQKELFETLEMLGPFGSDYPVPKFLLSNVRLSHINIFGYNHLRMRGTQSNGQSYPMIFFRHAKKSLGQWLLSKPCHIVDCVVNIQIDRRWNQQKATLIVEDIR